MTFPPFPVTVRAYSADDTMLAEVTLWTPGQAHEPTIFEHLAPIIARLHTVDACGRTVSRWSRAGTEVLA